jgi:hypothetical protein
VDNVHYGHLSEAVALFQRLEEVISSVPGFQHGDFTHFKDEHRIALVVLAEKELVCGSRHDRTQREQELEDLCRIPPKMGIRFRSSIRASCMAPSRVVET